MKRLLFFILTIALSSQILAQESLLQSGPMVAYSSMKEVLLWVQTTEEAQVHFEYWNIKNPSLKYKTKAQSTIKNDAFIAHCIADELEPGLKYEYSLFVNDQKIERPYRLQFESQAIWKWRGDAPDFSFATGSCAYISEEKSDRPGTPYGADYQIFEDIYKKQPNFMLWLGDNIYLREPDWNSKTGIQYRNTHSRSIPEMQAMLGSMHHYSIIDDHDYGPNDSDRGFHMKKETLKANKLFFPNPNYIFEEGHTGYFQWADCDFFLLDNRYWRTPNNRSDIEDHTILGEEQIQWLLDALSYSEASFKFVALGGQLLAPHASWERYTNIAPKERLRIIEAIEKLKINGVIFISGDVHYTELTKLDLKDGYPLYDLTVSPLTSGPNTNNAENPLRVEGTLYLDRNYSKINVSGSRNERALEINIYSSEGELQWTKEIKAKDLEFAKDHK